MKITSQNTTKDRQDRQEYSPLKLPPPADQNCTPLDRDKNNRSSETPSVFFIGEEGDDDFTSLEDIYKNHHHNIMDSASDSSPGSTDSNKSNKENVHTINNSIGTRGRDHSIASERAETRIFPVSREKESAFTIVKPNSKQLHGFQELPNVSQHYPSSNHDEEVPSNLVKRGFIEYDSHVIRHQKQQENPHGRIQQLTHEMQDLRRYVKELTISESVEIGDLRSRVKCLEIEVKAKDKMYQNQIQSYKNQLAEVLQSEIVRIGDLNLQINGLHSNLSDLNNIRSEGGYGESPSVSTCASTGNTRSHQIDESVTTANAIHAFDRDEEEGAEFVPLTPTSSEERKPSQYGTGTGSDENIALLRTMHEDKKRGLTQEIFDLKECIEKLSTLQKITHTND